MATAPVRIFPRSEDGAAYVLVQVNHVGTKPLDVKLVATEGNAPYACTLKHDELGSLIASQDAVPKEEWEHIIDSLLLKQWFCKNIQVTATVQPNATISLTVRRVIQGITQRLGDVVLKHDARERIELFYWCTASVSAQEASERKAVDLSAQIQHLETRVHDLQAELDALVVATQADDAALLQKFSDLLNEKKRKVREQQTLITSLSKHDDRSPAKASSPEAEGSPLGRPARGPGGKRKATSPATGTATEEDSDLTMENDRIKREPDDAEAGETSEATTSTAADASSGSVVDAFAGPAPPKPTITRKDADQGTPPPRTLPFKKGKPAASAPAPAAAADDEADDEL